MKQLMTRNELLAVRDNMETADLEALKSMMHSLLSHIQASEEETYLRYRTAYEVSSLSKNGNWRSRIVHSVHWRKRDAVRDQETIKYARVNVIHVIRINHEWYRLNVVPYRGIKGDPNTADISRLDYKANQNVQAVNTECQHIQGQV
jgi:hypothetical protein